jgi:hypothetical protein
MDIRFNSSRALLKKGAKIQRGAVKTILCRADVEMGMKKLLH